MIQYILFNSITEFSIWHEKIKKEKMIPFKGTANYTNAIFHPDVLDKRIICSFTSDISLTGLTVITEEQAKGYGWFNAEEVVAKEKIKKRIEEAQIFGLNIIKEFATENVFMGLTLSETAYVSNRMANVQSLLISGSLYTALAELESIETDEHLITEDRVSRYVYRLRHFLGLPT